MIIALWGLLAFGALQLTVDQFDYRLTWRRAVAMALLFAFGLFAASQVIGRLLS
jgi:hypothetical protein